MKDTLLSKNYDEKPKIGFWTIFASILCVAVIITSIVIIINRNTLQKKLIERGLVNSEYWYNVVYNIDIDGFEGVEEAEYEYYAEICLFFYPDGRGEKCVYYFSRDEEGFNVPDEEEGYYLLDDKVITAFTYEVISKDRVDIYMDGELAELYVSTNDDYISDGSNFTAREIPWNTDEYPRYPLYTRKSD